MDDNLDGDIFASLDEETSGKNSGREEISVDLVIALRVNLFGRFWRGYKNISRPQAPTYSTTAHEEDKHLKISEQYIYQLS